MKDKLFVLVGPTAIGKTSLSVKLAQALNGEIISADSMQVYKYMDIGTAKVTKEEANGVPHYMLDIVNPDENFTVSDYKENATEYIRDINNRGKLPIVVGGTGLYVNSLVYNLNFATAPPNDETREKLETFDNESLYIQLTNIDKESADRISLKDRKRIIRALEIYYTTGKTMTEYNKNFREENNDYNLAYVCLNMDRNLLYQRINKRVDIMLEEGLVDEVQSILDKGYDKDLIALQGIGYKEIIMYLENKIELEEAINQIKQGSRNYAKRQLTWFRRDNRIKWIDVDKFNNLHDISIEIENYVKNKLMI